MKTTSLVFTMLGFALLAGCTHSPEAASMASPPVIHTVSASPAGILVNGYLVETAQGVVAIDSALTVSDAKVSRAKLDALGKPLLAVLLTHGHPDHYNGVAELVRGRGEVPILSTAEVAKVIADSDAAKEKQWKPMFGAEWPERRVFPNRTVKDGERVTFDGASFTVHALGPGESHSDSYWRLEGSGSAAFIGDVVLAGVHAYVSDGHTTQWLRNLDQLEGELKGVKRIYPGHGQSGGVELLATQREYLRTYRAEVDTLRKGAAALGEAETKQLVEGMKRRYPALGLDFLIGLGANAVAAELATSQTSARR
jgi:glyoxylase-like metal-dependent hydrolase (beta-lactamase superfamily II)